VGTKGGDGRRHDSRECGKPLAEHLTKVGGNGNLNKGDICQKRLDEKIAKGRRRDTRRKSPLEKTGANENSDWKTERELVGLGQCTC